jgi:hypothetical protein
MSKIRKHSILIVLFLFSLNTYLQDISGSWRWFEEEDKAFEIFLEKANPDQLADYDFVGTHCGVYQNGNRMDCTLEENSIFIKQQGKNSFAGKIKSAYSLTEFEIRLTYTETEKKLLWEVTKEGEGLFYFPLKVILE